MPSPAQIAADPYWLPNRIDLRRAEVQFVRFSRAAIEGRDFLANQRGEAEAWISFDQVKAMHAPSLPPRFIFHSGFCASTLLLRALSGSGRAVGLNEPEILNSVAREGEALEPQLFAAILSLLFRRHPGREGVIVKPSNYPGRLIPQIMQLLPQARAVIVTNRLEDYLKAVARKGLLGRQWARQALLVASAYAGDIAPMRGQLDGLTDLQVAGLGWLLMQNWFDLIRGPDTEARFAVLHADSLTGADSAKALAAVGAHLRCELPPSEITAILAGPVFAQDAKTGVDYTILRAQQAVRSETPVILEEIAQVAEWIAALAAASGLRVPVPQTLLDAPSEALPVAVR